MLLQKSVNYDKFGKEQRKLQQNSMYCVWLGDILHITHMIKVDKCQISQHLSCGDIWTFSAWQMQRNFRFLHICYVKQSEISPHSQFFLHKYHLWYLWQISHMLVQEIYFHFKVTIFDQLQGLPNRYLTFSPSCWLRCLSNLEQLFKLIISWYICICRNNFLLNYDKTHCSNNKLSRIIVPQV